MVQFDPRTKLLLLLTTTTLMFSTANDGLMLYVKPLLSLVPFALLVSTGYWQTAAKYLLLYAVCFAAERIAFAWLHGAPTFAVLALTAIMTRFAPGIMMGAYFVATTSVSEFLTALGRWHVSEKLIIPLSVIFRFFPTLAEEYHAISDAMRLRGLRLGSACPGQLFTYRVVPLIVSVVGIGDELSAAALSRGLGAPVRRTKVYTVRFGAWDVAAWLFCLGCFGVFLWQQFLL